LQTNTLAGVLQAATPQAGMPEEPLLAGAVVKPGSKGRQERGWTLEGRDGFFQG